MRDYVTLPGVTPDYTLSSLTQPTDREPRRRRGLLIALVATAAVALVATSVAITLIATRDHGVSPGATTAAAGTRAPVLPGLVGTPDAEPTTPPDEFRDADELVHWLNQEGLPCAPVDHVDGPSVATSMIDCGPSIVVAVYEDHAHAQSGFDTLVAISKSPVHMAIGTNWTVSSDQPEYAQTVADRFAATYKTT